jgi:hypothetical protein
LIIIYQKGIVRCALITMASRGLGVCRTITGSSKIGEENYRTVQYRL